MYSWRLRFRLQQRSSCAVWDQDKVGRYCLHFSVCDGCWGERPQKPDYELLLAQRVSNPTTWMFRLADLYLVDISRMLSTLIRDVTPNGTSSGPPGIISWKSLILQL